MRTCRLPRPPRQSHASLSASPRNKPPRRLTLVTPHFRRFRKALLGPSPLRRVQHSPLCRYLRLRLHSTSRPTTIIVTTHLSMVKARAPGITLAWLAIPSRILRTPTPALRLVRKARLRAQPVPYRPRVYKPSWLPLVRTLQDRTTAHDERRETSIRLVETPRFVRPVFAIVRCFRSPTRGLLAPFTLVTTAHQSYRHVARCAQHTCCLLSFRSSCLAISSCTS